MMESPSPVSRHQCLIYSGAPSVQLPAIAAAARDMLQKKRRCIFLNSPPMIAGMRSYLAACGVDVTAEEANGSLVLTSELEHLDGRRFNVDRMIGSLQRALDGALRDGYEGLWATGDMGWEMGPERDYSSLLAYEWKLEAFLRNHPLVSGVCQYHVENLPADAIHVGRSTHSCFFVNETLSVVNPYYMAQQTA